MHGRSLSLASLIAALCMITGCTPGVVGGDPADGARAAAERDVSAVLRAAGLDAPEQRGDSLEQPCSSPSPMSSQREWSATSTAVIEPGSADSLFRRVAEEMSGEDGWELVGEGKSPVWPMRGIGLAHGERNVILVIDQAGRMVTVTAQSACY
ncbi:hypothetical protein J2Y69_002447 [Microbacterium resistens]|uniref:Lipoprotein n=1 Tax=Microbacterium resistens TaxID=156977 RepID=A0ABU1SE13_9MICO|nr:hypothetical protein [Microbacterium resistens]MDR6867839.1 hypothetical protein [Microbacterium resistens]